MNWKMVLAGRGAEICFLHHNSNVKKKKKKGISGTTLSKNTQIAYRPLQSGLSVLNFLEFFNLALIHILIQFPRGIFIRQRAPLH